MYVLLINLLFSNTVIHLRTHGLVLEWFVYVFSSNIFLSVEWLKTFRMIKL